MFRRLGILAVAAALGAGASIGVGACGEKRGSVSIEEGTGATGKSKAPTGTSPTATEPKTTTTVP